MLGALVRLLLAPALRRAERKRRSCLAVLLGAGCFAAGVGLAWLAGSWLLRAADATSWPTAAGVVERAKDGSGGTAYRYSVDGREYVGRHIRSTRVIYKGTLEREDISRLRPSDPCRVFYNPQDHADACLVPEAGIGPWAIAGFGAVFVLGGMVVLLKRPR